LGNDSSWAVGLGDFDNDGDLDALVNNITYNKLWLNDGSGFFSVLAEDYYNPRGTAGGVEVSDFDSDGGLDAFLVGAANNVFLNDGDGTFTQGTESHGGRHYLSAGDLDGDGDIDVFIGDGSGRATIQLNDGDGTFTEARRFNTYEWQGVALGDLDGDGDLDAFVTGSGDTLANKVLLNDGSANFTIMPQEYGSLFSHDVSLGDLDGDGDLDAYVANTSGNSVWFNNADGTFTLAAEDTGGHFYDTSLGDLDGDDDLDAFVAGSDGNNIRLNNGNGVFTTILSSDYGYFGWGGVALGDLDGDGDLDAFLVSRSSPDRVWFNNSRPQDIALNNTSAAEDSSGETVATITGTDPDSSTITYSLTNDTSGSFQVVDDNGTWQLATISGATLDFEVATSHSITIRADDGSGGITDTAFTINVTDVYDDTPPPPPPTSEINARDTVLEALEDIDLAVDTIDVINHIDNLGNHPGGNTYGPSINQALDQAILALESSGMSQTELGTALDTMLENDTPVWEPSNGKGNKGNNGIPGKLLWLIDSFMNLFQNPAA